MQQAIAAAAALERKAVKAQRRKDAKARARATAAATASLAENPAESSEMQDVPPPQTPPQQQQKQQQQQQQRQQRKGSEGARRQPSAPRPCSSGDGGRGRGRRRPAAPTPLTVDSHTVAPEPSQPMTNNAEAGNSTQSCEEKPSRKGAPGRSTPRHNAIKDPQDVEGSNSPHRRRRPRQSGKPAVGRAHQAEQCQVQTDRPAAGRSEDGSTSATEPRVPPLSTPRLQDRPANTSAACKPLSTFPAAQQMQPP